ncbi:MAG: outer membrane beta-barrel protein [Psychromonas sp.]
MLILVQLNTATAEQSVSVYGGLQGAFSSNVSGIDAHSEAFDFDATWEGNSFSAPIYYGFRYSNWLWGDQAITVDFAHAKVYADSDTLNDNDFNVLEFTDGLNILTINWLARAEKEHFYVRPYWGAGLGVTLPHVEVQKTNSTAKTYGYQFGGYAVQAQIGAEKKIAKNWGLFVEYTLNYSINNVDLENNGELQTNLVTNALNLGINYSF